MFLRSGGPAGRARPAENSDNLSKFPLSSNEPIQKAQDEPGCILGP